LNSCIAKLTGVAIPQHDSGHATMDPLRSTCRTKKRNRYLSGTSGIRTYSVRVLTVPASSYAHGSAQPVVIARRLSYAYLDCQAQPSQPRPGSRSRASWLSWHCTQPAGHRAGPHFTDHRRSFTESSRQSTRIRCLLPLAFQRAPPSGVSPAKCLTVIQEVPLGVR